MEILQLNSHIQYLIRLNMHDPLFLAVIGHATVDLNTSTYDTSFGEHGIEWQVGELVYEGRLTMNHMSQIAMSTRIVDKSYHYIEIEFHNLLDIRSIIESNALYSETSNKRDLYNPNQWKTHRL